MSSMASRPPGSVMVLDSNNSCENREVQGHGPRFGVRPRPGALALALAPAPARSAAEGGVDEALVVVDVADERRQALLPEPAVGDVDAERRRQLGGVGHPDRRQ